MKIRVICMLFLFLNFGCKNEGKLTFEPISFTHENCTDCPLVSISIPKALGTSKIDNTVNTAISNEIISLLNFDDEADAPNIQSAVSSFQIEYEAIKERFAKESMQWEAKINGEVAFEDRNILTVRLNSYLFTGGAHGYSTTRFLNFNKRKGVQLENEELFKNKEKFEGLAETKFRSQEKIPAKKPINSTGFMFETEAFYLPENIGYTKDGLQLFYEQYEVASYADGPIVLTLPYKEIKNHLAIKLKL